nr:MAG TPA: hypothetical protein [Caudoviricetes sp.]
MQSRTFLKSQRRTSSNIVGKQGTKPLLLFLCAL